MIVEHGLISFLQKFDEQPFLVKLGGKEYRIGEGEPTFTVKFNREIPLGDLLKSTSIALGEAYMNGDLEIEGDLYEALDHFLGQMGKFSTDQSALKKLMFTSTSKKNQEKEVRSHYDIGNDFCRLFLECADKVLKKGGVFLLHFISALKENPGDAWIKKYIFPGGTIPSLREMITAMADYNFHTIDVENLRLHYNRTLRCWRKNYLEHLDEVRKMFDEKFIRMWDLYLAACAATFHNGIIDLHQILMTKGINNELPMVRWY